MAKKTEDKSSAYIVISRIQDKEDSSVIYEAGDDVSHFSKERLEDLVSRGLVKGPDSE